MKKLISLLSLFIVVACQAQTVDEVLAKFENAVGGEDRLAAIRSLQITSTLKFDMMNQNLSITLNTIRDRNKFFRRQVSGVMGMGNSYTILTKDEGYTYSPIARGFGGNGFGGPGGGGPPRGAAPGGGGDNANKPVALDSLQRGNLAYELELEGPFAPLINYAAKGHKVELLGTAKANKTDCYKVKLTTKGGQEMIYYISTTDYLVVQTEGAVKVMLNEIGMTPILNMMGSDPRANQKITMQYNEYKSFGGIKFPVKQRLQYSALDMQIETSDIKINEPIDNKWYTMD